MDEANLKMLCDEVKDREQRCIDIFKTCWLLRRAKYVENLLSPHCLYVTLKNIWDLLLDSVVL